jgi:hypothetical protein
MIDLGRFAGFDACMVIVWSNVRSRLISTVFGRTNGTARVLAKIVGYVLQRAAGLTQLAGDEPDGLLGQPDSLDGCAEVGRNVTQRIDCLQELDLVAPAG